MSEHEVGEGQSEPRDEFREPAKTFVSLKRLKGGERTWSIGVTPDAQGGEVDRLMELALQADAKLEALYAEVNVLARPGRFPPGRRMA